MSKTTKIVLGAVVAVIIIIIISLVGIYNGLVGGRENVNKSWAQVENQYQRRFDLIPNLVESVKGAMKQEQQVFGDLAEARTKYAGAATTEEKVGAVNQVEGALARLLVIMENYPQLKANENFLQLQAQLEGTENRISVERKKFNEVVQQYNTSIKKFPASMLAGMFGFGEKQYFKAIQGADTPPKVEF